MGLIGVTLLYFLNGVNYTANVYRALKGLFRVSLLCGILVIFTDYKESL